jgi:hypothetical protein
MMRGKLGDVGLFHSLFSVTDALLDSLVTDL